MASFQVSPLNPQNDSEIPLGTSFLGAQGILAIRTFKINNNLTDTKAHFFIRRKQNRWKVIHCNKNGMFSPSKTNRGLFLLPRLPFSTFFSCYSPGLFRWIWAKSRDVCFWSKIWLKHDSAAAQIVGVSWCDSSQEETLGLSSTTAGTGFKMRVIEIFCRRFFPQKRYVLKRGF